MNDYSVPNEPEVLPFELKHIGRTVSDEFIGLFMNGCTTEGEAYRIKLPVDPGDYERCRRNVADGLGMARIRYNVDKPRNQQLTYRVHSEPGVMWVVIAKKYTN